MNKKLNRFVKEVQKYGNSRIVLVPECEVGDKIYVFTSEELDIIMGDKK